ncbi:helix-turn-helix transcriptional regulator [Saccharothrix saharensis]|uniref:helix-turn-helix transcriptional regulator n=1 Tax=Saccharothrix saharensis TaxID=571190 RepID=UPI00368B4AB4
MTDHHPPEAHTPAATRLAHTIKELREQAKLSQNQLGKRIGYTRQYISLAERPNHNLPSLDLVRALDHALNARGRLLTLREQAKTEQQKRRRGVRPTAPPRIRSEAGEVDPWLLADALTRSGITATALDHMERAAFLYAQRYPSIPPNALWPSVSGQIARVNEALSHPQPRRVRRRVASLLAVLTGIAGNLCLDLNQYDRADGYFDVAGLAALEAESSDLATWIFAVRSLGPYFTGDYRSAVELLVRAELESASSSPRRRAWVSALLARAHAAMGDTHASLRALDTARRHVEAINTPPPGHRLLRRCSLGRPRRHHLPPAASNSTGHGVAAHGAQPAR